MLDKGMRQTGQSAWANSILIVQQCHKFLAQFATTYTLMIRGTFFRILLARLWKVILCPHLHGIRASNIHSRASTFDPLRDLACRRGSTFWYNDRSSGVLWKILNYENGWIRSGQHRGPSCTCASMFLDPAASSQLFEGLSQYSIFQYSSILVISILYFH